MANWPHGETLTATSPIAAWVYLTHRQPPHGLMLSPRSPLPRLADSHIPDRRDVPTISRLAFQMLADAVYRPRCLRVIELDVMEQRGDFAQGGRALTAAEP
jgi:hypothetical protein